MLIKIIFHYLFTGVAFLATHTYAQFREFILKATIVHFIMIMCINFYIQS